MSQESMIIALEEMARITRMSKDKLEKYSCKTCGADADTYALWCEKLAEEIKQSTQGEVK